MTADTWFAYVATVLVFMSTPGPSQLLMASNAMSQGFGRALFVAAGDLSANTLQILAAGFGLAALVIASENAFQIVKWGGVAYLLWLGVKQILAARRTGLQPARRDLRSLRGNWALGFMTSAANPKAVVFFAALFPQFLDPSSALWPQIAILGATYLLIDGVFLVFYGLSADWLAKTFVGRARVWLERAAGGCLIAAAALLGLKSIER